MKATITAALIGIFLLAGVSDISAKSTCQALISSCECINPFGPVGPNGWKGNPDYLCAGDGPGFCYVACNSACRDQEPAASHGRCQSTAACEVHNGSCLEK